MSIPISVMQTIGILLVVTGHSFYMSGDNPLCYWIYSFHMPLFFFISGFLFRHSCERRGTPPQNMRIWGREGMAYGKAMRLLVPYLVISTLAFVPKALLSAMAVRPTELSLSAYLHNMIYPYDNVIGSFWFLPTLYIIFIAFTLCMRIRSAATPLLAILVAASPLLTIGKTMPLNLDGALYFMPYFVMGYVCRERGWHHTVAVHSKILAPATLILSMALLYVSIHTSLSITNILSATCGIVMCLSAGYLYEKKGLHFLDPLFGASYSIYIYSWFVQAICFQIIMRLTGLPLFPMAVTATVLGVAMPLLLHRWMTGGRPTVLKRAVAFVSGQKRTLQKTI